MSGEAVKTLEKRVLNVMREQRETFAFNSISGGTLERDQTQGYSRRSESRRKTKAERAAEKARRQALLEAIELLTGEAVSDATVRLLAVVDSEAPDA